jgi:uncharacterized protein (DUF885 family)
VAEAPARRRARGLALMLALPALLAGGCKMARPGTMSPPTPPTAAGTANPVLRGLADEYWEKRLEGDPIEATLIGERRFDDRVPDPSPEANASEIQRLKALAGRVSTIEAGALGTADRVTRAALLGEIDGEIAARECAIGEWAVDPRDGPQVALLNLAHLQTVKDPAQGRALVARWQKLASYLDGRAANLRRSLGQGRVATRESVERVLGQLDQLLARPGSQWVLAEPARAAHPDWTGADRKALKDGVEGAVEGAIRPAFERYRDVIRKQILPKARGDQQVGLSHIPGGKECYEKLIRVHTSLSLPAQQIHQVGLEENAKIRAEMIALGRRLFGTGELAAIQQRLRSDKALYFATREQVEAKAAEALRRAEAAMPRWFGEITKIPCLVKRVEAYEEKDTTIAYYRQPAVDGSRPGTYYINTYAPETRPRYEAEALAFHESVPGHHTQIALAQEQTELPEFRKHLGVTAYVEGWALYTERLSEEMGLYSGDLDRMGMLSFDAWRASRLVVDTGLHQLGWDRQRAIQYMLENTALARNNIENEVDRYIGWPGQALAYKLGQREIFALRAQAQQQLGPRFDIRAFHDNILAHGAVSLPVLREEIERWIAASK